MGSGRPSLSFSTGPQLPDAPFKPSKRSETFKPALGAATKLNLLNRLLELPNYGLWQAKSFLLSAPNLPNWLLELPRNLPNQTMGCGRPSLSLSTGPKLPDAPFKPSKRSETSKPALGAATKPAKPALGAAKLWALAGHVFPFLPARNCRMLPSNPPNAPKLQNRLLELPRNLPNRLLELPNYGLWQAKSFLFYRPATAGCSLQTLQTLRNFQTGSWSCHKTCHTGSWSCQTMGCGRPSLSFSTGPKLPEADGNQDNLEWSLELALRGQVGRHLETSSAANPAHFQGLKKNMYTICLGFIPQFLLHSSQNCVNKKTPT